MEILHSFQQSDPCGSCKGFTLPFLGSNSHAKCRAVFQQMTVFHRVKRGRPRITTWKVTGEVGTSSWCKMINTCKWHPEMWNTHESQTIPSMAISKYFKMSILFQAEGLDRWTDWKIPWLWRPRSLWTTMTCRDLSLLDQPLLWEDPPATSPSHVWTNGCHSRRSMGYFHLGVARWSGIDRVCMNRSQESFVLHSLPVFVVLSPARSFGLNNTIQEELLVAQSSLFTNSETHPDSFPQNKLDWVTR